MKSKICEVIDGSKSIDYFTKIDSVTIQDPHIKGFSLQIIHADKLAKKDAIRFVKEDPFLPPFEEGLFIQDLQDHRIIANKFALVKYHILVTSKLFEDQNSLLGPKDFSASFPPMKGLKGLCFYNGGPVSGASQPHRHIQVMPISKDFPQAIVSQIDLEMKESAVDSSQIDFKTHNLSFFRRYRHCIVELPAYDPDASSKSMEEFTQVYHQRYLFLLDSLHNSDLKYSYNLLWTEKWMFMMIRSKETIMDRYSVNSMGMLGSILAKSRSDKEILSKLTPTEIFDEICMML